MNKTALTLNFAVVVLLFSLTPAGAADDLPRFMVEGRFGAIGIESGGFLDISEGNHFSLGALVAYRPTAIPPLNRFTGRLSIDGAGLGGQDLATGYKNVERLYLVNFALGFDAVHTDRFAVTLHGGGAISRDRFVLQAFSQFGGSFGTGGYVSACSLGPNLCDSVWNFLGNAGAEVRVVPRGSWPFFFIGVDYTRFAGAKNQTMFTTGISF